MRKQCPFLFLFLICLALLGPSPAYSMDSTDILPRGVTSPAVRFGIVSGVDSKYNSNGTVQTLNEINTINFNADQLAKLDPEISSLVAILNQFSQQQLGSQLNLGTLRVETEPDVKYVAPILARGITDSFTLAIALPIVLYKNTLRFNQSASNISAICSQFTGLENDITALKNACRDLNVKVVDATKNELNKKGYKSIENRNETVPGDLQLVGLWKTHESGNHSSLFRTTLTLPTGQKNDPDDLVDLGVFGFTAVEPLFLFNYLPHKSIRLATKASYKIVIPDSVEKRVPRDEGDFLPAQDSKEKVSRNVGDTLTLGGAANFSFWNSLVVAGGYEYSYKGIDSYSGKRNRPYGLLAKDSDSEAHRLRAGISYDTIGLYKKTQSFPPLKLEFEVINTIAGKNSERQLVNEFSLTMFF